MINLLILYFTIGILLYLIFNGTLWAIRSETFTFTESIAVIVLWPTFLVGVVNSYYGYEEEVDD